LVLQTSFIQDQAELGMNNRIETQYEDIDRKTSRSICNGVGELLRQKLRPEPSLSPRLQQLMDELRRRDQQQNTGTSH
jgi:hypothetical protein